MWKSNGLKRLFLQAKQQRTSGADINSGDEKQNISKGLFFFLGTRLNEVRLN